MSEGYVLEIQPSARRTNGVAGAAVHRAGTRHRFDDRAAAEDWAADLAARGERPVWVRAANPNDERGVDAYLMGRYARLAVDRTESRQSGGDNAGRDRLGADNPGRDRSGGDRTGTVGDQSRLPAANGD